VNCVVAEGRIPNVVINCFKGKGDALKRGNYRGLKLLDQVMKVMVIIRTQVNINKIPSNELKERLHLIGVEDALQWGTPMV